MTPKRKKTAAYRGVRMPPETRRTMIVDAALRALADRGFEGLRTRDVAADAGINSATLHHYFPTKNDLVVAVADELRTRFQTKPDRAGRESTSPQRAFRQQFDDVLHYQTEQPELLAVYRELAVRATRDAFVARLVAELNRTWRDDVRSILEHARDRGVLRDTVDVDVAARIVVSAIWDMSMVSQSRAELDALHRQLAALLMIGPKESGL